MKITKEIYDKMVQTPEGGVSSTRVMAWDTWMFLKKLIIVFLSVMLVMAVIVSWLGIELDMNIIKYVIGSFLGIVGILLIAIYAPKQFSKMSEVKELLGLANGKKQ